jgi:hypothetical protein
VLGAVKRQKFFPPVPQTTQIERNDAQTRRIWIRSGFNPETKTGRDVSDRIFWIVLDWKKIRSETSLKNPIRNVSTIVTVQRGKIV